MKMVTNTDLIKKLQGFPEGTPVLQFSVQAKVYHSAPVYLASMNVDRSQPAQKGLAEWLEGKEVIIL